MGHVRNRLLEATFWLVMERVLPVIHTVGGEYSWSTYVDINAPNGATAPRHPPFNPVFNVGQDGPTRQQKK